MESAQELVIDEISTRDLDGIVAIEDVSFPSPWPRRLFEREIESERSYNRVMRISNAVVGYIITWTIYDEVHILNIAVHPEYREMGLGERLLTHCIRHSASNNMKYAILEVRTSNTGAQNLYEKLGFRTVQTRKKYYSDTGEDAFVMMLEI